MSLETWQECVERVAGRYGLQLECLDSYFMALQNGATEARAAWEALYEWDCLDLNDKNQLVVTRIER